MCTWKTPNHPEGHDVFSDVPNCHIYYKIIIFRIIIDREKVEQVERRVRTSFSWPGAIQECGKAISLCVLEQVS